MSLLQRVFAVIAIAGTLAIPTSVNAGLIWSEQDAGDLLSSAEIISGTPDTELTGITGFLTSVAPVNEVPVFEVDLYKIYIDAPSLFSASASSVADTALFLFDGLGGAVYMNDDAPSVLGSLLPAGESASPATAGFYYLGIAFGGYLPFDYLSLALFDYTVDRLTDVIGGNSGVGPLASWGFLFDANAEAPYGYEIALTGARNGPGTVPEPGTLSLVLLAGLFARLQRRRAA